MLLPYVPALFFGLLDAAAFLLDRAGYHPRGVPYLLLVWGSLLSALFALWRLTGALCDRQAKTPSPVRAAAVLAASALSGYLLLLSLGLSVFGGTAAEQRLEWEGKSYLVRTVYWVDTVYEYREYLGPLWYGQRYPYREVPEALRRAVERDA